MSDKRSIQVYFSFYDRSYPLETLPTSTIKQCCVEAIFKPERIYPLTWEKLGEIKFDFYFVRFLSH